MVITVQCPSCAKSFPVDSNKIPEKGVSVRCSACSEVFRIERPAEPTPPPAPEPPVIEAAAPEPVIDEAPTFSAPEPEPEPEAPEPEAEEAPSFESPSFEMDETQFESRDRDRDAENDFSIGTETAPAADTSSNTDDWVFETEPEIDPGSLDIEAVETVESHVEEAKDESSFFGGPVEIETTEIRSDETVTPTVDDEPVGETVEPAAPEPTMMPPLESEMAAGDAETAADEAPEEAESAPAPAVGAFTFGKRDPKDKARRLARVLVSDMIMYNPDRHERALANGTLKEDFEEEIQKSWKEYVEQVGDEMARSNDFWTEALNDVLAKGQPIF